MRRERPSPPTPLPLTQERGEGSSGKKRGVAPSANASDADAGKGRRQYLARKGKKAEGESYATMPNAGDGRRGRRRTSAAMQIRARQLRHEQTPTEAKLWDS